jgi:ATP-dependent DNA ligase
MSDIKIMKAVEYDKLPAKYKKATPFESITDETHWLQPKYDGCFGMAVIHDDPADSRMLSRTGEDYSASCGHILDELRSRVIGSGMNMVFPFVVLGEVWHPEWDFPKISGCFRRQSPSPELHFVACDLLPEGLTTPVPYSYRLSALMELVPIHAYCPGDYRTYTTENWTAWGTDAQTLARRLKENGQYDGAILRDPTKGYTIGLVKQGEVIKVKPLMSLDLRVWSRGWELGEKTGRKVWTIEVDYKGVKTSVGSGVPHNEEDVPLNNQIVEIECMGITEDGKLREPRFKGIRHDKESAD